MVRGRRSGRRWGRRARPLVSSLSSTAIHAECAPGVERLCVRALFSFFELCDRCAMVPGMGAQGVMLATSGASPVRLKCLGGGVVSDEYLADARRVDKLGDGALEALGPLLAPTILSALTRELGEHLSRFCLQHEVAEADLGHVLKVCRWLVREAANVDLCRDDLAADLKTLWQDPGILGDVLLEHYEPIKRALREQMVNDALLMHGNALVDVEWRVDQIASDRHTARLGVPVAIVTLIYKNADRGDRLTLQITSEQLGRLSQVFGALGQKTRLAGAFDAGSRGVNQE